MTASHSTVSPADGAAEQAISNTNDHNLRIWIVVFAITGTAALLALLPMFRFGIASGHDFEFHLNSWMEVALQWRQGIVYPRWAEMANFGFGEPRFIFYPPASWMLGGALGTLLPWKLVPGVYLWLVLTASGCSMFVLARRYLSFQDAVFAAALYAVNPYHLVIVYWRSAFAELMAAIWMPLLLFTVLGLRERDRKSSLRLAAVIALVWLTNLPAAVMATYSVALLVCVQSFRRRSPRLLLTGVAACALGMAGSSFYLLPAAYERRWVNIQQALDPIVRPSNNFLFTLMNDVMHNRFNRLVSTIAVIEISLFVFAALWLWRRDEHDSELPVSLIAWGSAASLLMVAITWPLWQFLPQLRYVQLPWRWLLCLNVGVALLLVLAVRRWAARVLIYFMLVLALAAVWRWVQPPWWDKAADLSKMFNDIKQERGYESVSEYLPVGASVDNTPENPPRAVAEDESARIAVESWGTEEKMIRVTAAAPTRVVLRLFAYPAWQAEVNGRLIQYESDEDIRQVIIPVPKGESQVRVVLARTWDRKIGAIITILVLSLAIGLWLTSSGDASERPLTSH